MSYNSVLVQRGTRRRKQSICGVLLYNLCPVSQDPTQLKARERSAHRHRLLAAARYTLPSSSSASASALPLSHLLISLYLQSKTLPSLAERVRTTFIYHNRRHLSCRPIWQCFRPLNFQRFVSVPFPHISSHNPSRLHSILLVYGARTGAVQQGRG